MGDLDLLGAEGLAGQAVVLRIRSIDSQKLARAIGGGPAAAALPAALAIVNLAPQQALGLLLPYAADRVRTDYGVDLDFDVRDAAGLGAAPARKASPAGGTLAKIAVGVLLGLGGAYAASRLGVTSAAGQLLHKVGAR